MYSLSGILFTVIYLSCMFLGFCQTMLQLLIILLESSTGELLCVLQIYDIQSHRCTINNSAVSHSKRQVAHKGTVVMVPVLDKIRSDKVR